MGANALKALSDDGSAVGDSGGEVALCEKENLQHWNMDNCGTTTDRNEAANGSAMCLLVVRCLAHPSFRDAVSKYALKGNDQFRATRVGTCQEKKRIFEAFMNFYAIDESLYIPIEIPYGKGDGQMEHCERRYKTCIISYLHGTAIAVLRYAPAPVSVFKACILSIVRTR